ncbi:MAG: thymidine phosphorylase [Thermoanaerobaculum sp.]|nr:thymidine phosphorylase [Thermoanaerobaculum sp.]MDW7967985.1 thymidine phosphorylase [Thermoanaerobaculum sp.]
MNFVEVIAKKRDGQELSREEVWHFVRGATDGSIADAQLAAMLMAICLRGASPRETQYLVEAMATSGQLWELARDFPELVDKHSTGGVGDTVSLVFAPWLAACGVPVAMMAGAGLGHTQGTLDKLAAVPGFVPAAQREEALLRLQRCGVVFARQSEVIAPADRVLYALRDVTATVPSLPLIVSSIMSKKLAVGAGKLVLDVKCGRGAFRKTLEEARELAQALVAVAKQAGVAVRAVVSAMDEPLGPALGCAEEVREALACLEGHGDARLMELSQTLALHALQLVGKSPVQAKQELQQALASGRARQAWDDLVRAHGGDPDPRVLPRSQQSLEVVSPCSGFVTALDGEALGWTAVSLGAGRRFPGDEVDWSAFLRVLVRCGDWVEEGQPLARLGWTARSLDPEALMVRVRQAITVGPTAPSPTPLVLQELL